MCSRCSSRACLAFASASPKDVVATRRTSGVDPVSRPCLAAGITSSAAAGKNKGPTAKAAGSGFLAGFPDAASGSAAHGDRVGRARNRADSTPAGPVKGGPYEGYLVSER